MQLEVVVLMLILGLSKKFLGLIWHGELTHLDKQIWSHKHPHIHHTTYYSCKIH